MMFQSSPCYDPIRQEEKVRGAVVWKHSIGGLIVCLEVQDT